MDVDAPVPPGKDEVIGDVGDEEEDEEDEEQEDGEGEEYGGFPYASTLGARPGH